MMRGATAVVMLALAVALAGGTDRAGAAPAPVYRVAADRLCATANARLAAVPVPRTSGEVRPWVGRAVTIMGASTRRIRALTPPPALPPSIAEITKGVQGAGPGQRTPPPEPPAPPMTLGVDRVTDRAPSSDLEAPSRPPVVWAWAV